MPVVYGTATVIGGASPVTTTCTPASGSQFGLGTTAVSCTATDSRQRVDSCSFPVVVQAPPRISLTRFVAFGDSITRGEDGNVISLVPRLFPQVILVDKAYPLVLQQQLAFRYTTQALQVTNEGNPGEYAGWSSTLARFAAVTARNYDAVLLMEGTNDLFEQDPLDIPPAITNLRAMVRDGRSRNLRVYLATVPPMNPLGRRGGAWNLVPVLNDQIRSVAFQEGVPLVDINQAFGGNLSLLSSDGLHPNADGYARIADTFFLAIRATLEVAPTLTAFPAGAARVTRPDRAQP
jgi:lysophospholipase L1-like esterase